MLAWLLPAVATAQTGVVPQTAGQNLVRWHDFDWQYVDLLDDDGVGKGVRLYYYKGEREVAERAAAAVEEEYRELVRRFNYKPEIRVPYILYNSHQEFEQSNVFFVSEHVLGVTSTTDLKMALAYWGDHTRFRHTSLHEMVHQFTIQKVNSIADKSRASGSPLPKIPLWFVEGAAEWYSTPGGIDTETEMYLRDLVTNENAFTGFVLPPFLSDDFRSFIYTYKLGQGRIHFLAETYGEETIQEILENSYRLRGHRRPVTTTPTSPQSPDTPTTEARREAMNQQERVLDFAGLLRLATGDRLSEIQEKWERWLKTRYYKQYLETDQNFADFKALPGTPRYADLFATAHGGEVVVHRTIEPVTGFTRLYVVDTRDPSSRVKIAEDGKPGNDSLHFYDRPVVAVTDDQIVYVARRGPNDVVYTRKYKRTERDPVPGTRQDALTENGETLDGPEPILLDEDDAEARMLKRIRFSLGKRRLLYNPSPDGILEVGSPSFSPDGTQLAFVGLTDDGVTDIFVLDLDSRKVTRLTNDAYAEKELDWGAGGIVYNADATEHGKFNLFVANPITGKVKRIGWRDETQRHPAWTPTGRAVTYTADGDGKMDVYFLPVEETVPRVSTASLDAGVKTSLLASANDATVPAESESLEAKRLTDFPTGIMQGRIVGDRLLAMGLKGGQMRLFAAQVDGLETKAAPLQTPREYATWEIPQRDLPGSLEYSPFSIKSWRLEDAFAVLSSQAYGGGYLLFQDRMRDRTTILDFQIFGAPELTSAQLVYLDRKSRVGWGASAFHDAYVFLDPLTSEQPPPQVLGDSWTEVLYVERTIGAAGLVEYPLSRYLRLSGGMGIAAVLREPCFATYTYANDPTIGDYIGREGTCTNLKFGKFDINGDTTKYDQWDAIYGDPDGIVQLSAAVGYDTLARSYATGPLHGNSVILSTEYNILPLRGAGYGEVQLDAQKYFRVWRTANLHFRGAAGASYGNQFTRQFYVWPIYNLRGIPFSSTQSENFIGTYYTVGTSELQVPLDRLIRLAIFQNIEGIAAIDVGSVFDDPADYGAKSTAAFVTGVNFNLAIFQFRLHFARPFDIGGLEPGKDLPDKWVTNFSIEYLFF